MAGTGVLRLGSAARRLISPDRWTDGYPGPVAYSRELDVLLDWASKRNYLKRFVPNIEAKNTKRDEALNELRLNVKVLRSLIGAIESRRAIKIFYQSMNDDRPRPMWRWIVPHALAHDGLRWHVRAFCEETKKFKDFVLSRCLDSGEGRETEIRADEDREWNEVFSVVLIPNPRLSPDQQEVISQDYCMDYGQIAVSVRKALLYYFNKRLRLDVAKAIDNPKETPVVVLNEKAFNDVLAGLEPN